MEISDNNYEIVYLFIVYVYFILGLCFLSEGYIHRNYIIILGYFLFKMLTSYDKCTISYIECKIRNVKKEEGYLNDFLQSITNLRDTKHKNILYAISSIFILFYIKQETTHLIV
jgi:hypothetical protein